MDFSIQCQFPPALLQLPLPLFCSWKLPSCLRAFAPAVLLQGSWRDFLFKSKVSFLKRLLLTSASNIGSLLLSPTLSSMSWNRRSSGQGSLSGFAHGHISSTWECPSHPRCSYILFELNTEGIYPCFIFSLVLISTKYHPVYLFICLLVC